MKRSKLNQHKLFMSLTEEERKFLAQKYFNLNKPVDFTNFDTFFKTYFKK